MSSLPLGVHRVVDTRGHCLGLAVEASLADLALSQLLLLLLIEVDLDAVVGGVDWLQGRGCTTAGITTLTIKRIKDVLHVLHLPLRLQLLILKLQYHVLEIVDLPIDAALG